MTPTLALTPVTPGSFTPLVPASRVLGPVLDVVADFGATPGGESAAHIQAALDAAHTAGGATVVVPGDDSFLLSAKLKIYSNTNFYALARATLITNPTNGAAEPIQVEVQNNATNVTVQGFILDGNESGYTTLTGNTTGGSITLNHNVSHIRILDNEIRNNKSHGIKSSDLTGQTVEWAWILRNYIHDMAVTHVCSGMYLSNFRNFWVVGNYVYNTEDDNIALISDYVTGQDYCSDGVVAHNVCDLVRVRGSNLGLSGLRVHAHHNVCSRSDNSQTTNTQNGAIRLRWSDPDTAFTAPYDCTIDHNVVYSAGVVGIRVDAARTVVADNIVNGTSHGEGILVTNQTAGTYPAELGTIDVHGNQTFDTASHGIYADPAALNLGIVRIEGNGVTNPVGNGVRLSSSASGSADSVRIRDNVVRGGAGTTDCIFVGGPATWTDVTLDDNECTGGTSDINIAGGTITRLRGRHKIVTGFTNALNQGQFLLFGAGSPVATYAAGVGSMFYRSDGGTGTTVYYLEAAGKTAWTRVNGRKRVVTKTADYTATADDDLILVDTVTTGSVTVTLPSAASTNGGREYRIKRTTAGANSCTIATTSSQTIDGATTLSLPNQYDAVTLISDSSNWHITSVRGSTLGL